jgi:hypothetical protein
MAYLLQQGGGRVSIQGGGAILLRGGEPADETFSGGWPERPRKRRWHVKRPDGALEYFDSVEAAYARFEALFAPPEPKAKRRGVQRISIPAIPARTVAFDGADATRSFARLARDAYADEARIAVATMLAEIEADALRRARQLADDDEAAALLLLM